MRPIFDPSHSIGSEPLSAALTKGWLAEITLLQPGANTQALWTDIMNKMALKVAAGFKVTFGRFDRCTKTWISLRTLMDSHIRRFLGSRSGQAFRSRHHRRELL